jgi:hypothetical protein
MVAELRQALAAALRAGLTGVQVSPYMTSSPTAPSAFLFPSTVDYDQAFGRGLDEYAFQLQAFVGEVSDVGAQTTLDRMLEPSGAGSVKAAVEADPTLGGLVDDVTVTRFEGYRRFAVEGRGVVLGAEWSIRIRAGGGA